MTFLYELYVFLFFSLLYILGPLGWWSLLPIVLLWGYLLYRRRHRARKQGLLRRLWGAFGLLLLTLLILLGIGMIGSALDNAWAIWYINNHLP